MRNSRFALFGTSKAMSGVTPSITWAGISTPVAPEVGAARRDPAGNRDLDGTTVGQLVLLLDRVLAERGLAHDQCPSGLLKHSRDYLGG